ncbi:MAG TPA: glutathione S-transferase family protein [Gammaproteobacteria bacterium]|nr:glutathione S-transferase [Chromatiales bacterium]MDP7297557.1 glutathione S-transferase family protein [Gammaproteobacteria bacterium]MDP7660776.1 glutathione S-transferase family protein [Gammaproteobacteria bacterium]HJP38476.1 glutathione S-transferase family protein [Gammaproteobacteria bacterium]
MRLFDFERAPNPRRVRIFIAEKNLDIPRVAIDLFAMEQLAPEFLAINPGGTVPVLETDDGIYISESIAICRYLESLYPEPALFGTEARSAALVLMWNNICENEGYPAVAEILRNLSPGFHQRAFPGPTDFAQIPALVERGRCRAEQFFARIEAQLSSSEFLAGESFSVADITLLALVDFSTWVDLDAAAGRPALDAWHQNISARPSTNA